MNAFPDPGSGNSSQCLNLTTTACYSPLLFHRDPHIAHRTPCVPAAHVGQQSQAFKQLRLIAHPVGRTARTGLTPCGWRVSRSWMDAMRSRRPDLHVDPLQPPPPQPPVTHFKTQAHKQRPAWQGGGRPIKIYPTHTQLDLDQGPDLDYALTNLRLASLLYVDQHATNKTTCNNPILLCKASLILLILLCKHPSD